MNEKQIKNIFISQPMAEKTDEEIKIERAQALVDVCNRINKPVREIQSFFNEAPKDAKPLWFIGESIKMMAEADIVYFCKGWENQRGCKIEFDCAVKYGKTCMFA